MLKERETWQGGNHQLVKQKNWKILRKTKSSTHLLGLRAGLLKDGKAQLQRDGGGELAVHHAARSSVEIEVPGSKRNRTIKKGVL